MKFCFQRIVLLGVAVTLLIIVHLNMRSHSVSRDFLVFSCSQERSSNNKSDRHTQRLVETIWMKFFVAGKNHYGVLKSYALISSNTGLIRQGWGIQLFPSLKYHQKNNKDIVELSSQISPDNINNCNGTGFDMKSANKPFIVFQRQHKQPNFKGVETELAIDHRSTLHREIRTEGTKGEGAAFLFTLFQETNILTALQQNYGHQHQHC
jgi:light-regulated signal transduction histidine kinase (bacteriophytochrome)